MSLTSPIPSLPFRFLYLCPHLEHNVPLNFEFYTSHLVKAVVSVISVFISCLLALPFISTSFPGSPAHWYSSKSAPLSSLVFFLNTKLLNSLLDLLLSQGRLLKSYGRTEILVQFLVREMKPGQSSGSSLLLKDYSQKVKENDLPNHNIYTVKSNLVLLSLQSISSDPFFTEWKMQKVWELGI